MKNLSGFQIFIQEFFGGKPQCFRFIFFVNQDFLDFDSFVLAISIAFKVGYTYQRH
jgi:hypothetical protein